TREVLKPYIEARQVDLFLVPGEVMQMPVYNDAVRKFRFATRYMAFLDCDEFIFPKTPQSIVEVVDEVLSKNERASGLAINWQIFGSNGLEKADYSKGVLERFTRRAPSDWFEPPTKNSLPVGNIHVKTIANPRLIRYIVNPHYAYYFDGVFAVNSAGGRVTHWGNEPILADKIVVNHYLTKSKEEFQGKLERGRKGVDSQIKDPVTVDEESFAKNDRNDVEDDGILSYRDIRAEQYTPPKAFEREVYFKALEEVLLPASRSDTPAEFFEGKLETFLTCRALASVLRRSFPKDNRGAFLEESALRAINRTQLSRISLTEVMELLNSLPPILAMPYPIVDDILKNCMSFVNQLMGDLRKNLRWESFVDMTNYLDLLAAFAVKNRLRSS
ncbi:MAG: glycosyltransferase family 92 protein, partial [Selenomonadaceae bacterium]|nr:glycosyltransferase family 92 protein [Selenomonadaceae bacterium]